MQACETIPKPCRYHDRRPVCIGPDRLFPAQKNRLHWRFFPPSEPPKELRSSRRSEPARTARSQLVSRSISSSITFFAMRTSATSATIGITRLSGPAAAARRIARTCARMISLWRKLKRTARRPKRRIPLALLQVRSDLTTDIKQPHDRAILSRSLDEQLYKSRYCSSSELINPGRDNRNSDRNSPTPHAPKSRTA